jgi:hypothetical protein
MPRTRAEKSVDKHGGHPKNRNPMFSVPKVRKHRQNRSNPLTQGRPANGELAPAVPNEPN